MFYHYYRQYKSVIFIVSIVSLWGIHSATAFATESTRTEIQELLDKLQTSGCKFNRNGYWYSASEARTHLLRKLAYIEGKGSVITTEQFIALSASKSSVSGQLYQVKCGEQLPVASQVWLTQELAAIRSSASKVTKP